MAVILDTLKIGEAVEGNLADGRGWTPWEKGLPNVKNN